MKENGAMEFEREMDIISIRSARTTILASSITIANTAREG
jgi:hypothetical protein